jgi:hypothetical protein
LLEGFKLKIQILKKDLSFLFLPDQLAHFI